jgi:hypothetical protein
MVLESAKKKVVALKSVSPLNFSQGPALGLAKPRREKRRQEPRGLAAEQAGGVPRRQGGQVSWEVELVDGEGQHRYKL